MTLEGASILKDTDNSTIYAINSPQVGQYCVVIPKNSVGVMSMLVDINMKSLFDSVASNMITRDELIDKIISKYKVVSSSYSDAMLVFPMLDKNELIVAIGSGDKQKMFDEVKRIGGITSELYKKLTVSLVDASKISQKIIIVESDDNDAKFVSWLKTQMPNFVDGVLFSDLEAKANSNVNPFMGGGNGIFDTPLSQGVNNSNSIFDNVNNSNPVGEGVGTNNVASEQVNNTSPVNNDIFAQQQPVPNEQPVSNASVDVQPASNTNVVAPEPQPINNVPLTDNVNDGTVSADDGEGEHKKSGGFVNLLILLVILVVVTVASIELGKFLFNTFGK